MILRGYTNFMTESHCFYGGTQPVGTKLAWPRFIVSTGVITPGVLNSHDQGSLFLRGFSTRMTKGHCFYRGTHTWGYSTRMAKGHCSYGGTHTWGYSTRMIKGRCSYGGTHTWGYQLAWPRVIVSTGVLTPGGTQLAWPRFIVPTGVPNLGVLNSHDQGSLFLWGYTTWTTWASSFLQDYKTCMTWDAISARMAEDATMTSDHISEILTWCGVKNTFGMSENFEGYTLQILSVMNTMEQGPYWETNSRSTGQMILLPLWNPKVFKVFTGASWGHSKNLTVYLFEINVYFNIILPSTPRSLKWPHFSSPLCVVIIPLITSSLVNVLTFIRVWKAAKEFVFYGLTT
jgi:hypothetical protein